MSKINNNNNRDISNNKFFYYDRLKKIKYSPLLLSNTPHNEYYEKSLKPFSYNKYKMSHKNNYPYNIKNALDNLQYENNYNNNTNENIFGTLNNIDTNYNYLFYNKDHNPFFTANYNSIPKQQVFLTTFSNMFFLT